MRNMLGKRTDAFTKKSCIKKIGIGQKILTIIYIDEMNPYNNYQDFLAVLVQINIVLNGKAMMEEQVRLK